MPSLINYIARDVKNDINAARKMRLPWWAYASLLICLPIYWLFDQAGIVRLAFPTLIFTAVLCAAVTTKWELRQRVWFWIAATILAAAHVPLILFVPWDTRYIPGPAAAAIGLVDLVAMLTVLDVVARLVKTPKEPMSPAPRDRIGPSLK